MGHVDDGTLNALLDQELDAAEATEVSAHLAACAACAARYEEARRFLDGAAELLGVLTPPAVAPAPRARPTPVEVLRPEVPPAAVAPVPIPPEALEAGVAPLAPVGPASASSEPPRRISKTKKEVAIDLDGATQKSPAIAPNVALPGERVPEPAPPAPAPGVRPLLRTRPEGAVPRPRRDWQTMAWAASMVLCLGVGYLANEVRHGRVAAAPDSAMTTAAEPAATARRDVAAAPARPQAPDPKAISGLASNTQARKSPAERPRRPAAALDAVPLADAGLAPGVAARQPAAEMAGAAPAPMARALPSAAPSAAGGGARTGLAAVFRTTNVDSAALRLGGTLRTLEGLALEGTKIGPGVLVTGAVPARDVVRLVYTNPSGGRFFLDQQRVPGSRGAPVPEALGLQYGDTLVTMGYGGESRIRWLDRAGLWMSLSGPLPPDSLRALLARVR